MEPPKENDKNTNPLLYAGNEPGTSMYEYFATKLPEGLTEEHYQKGLGCEGTARLVIEELGGGEKARIYWVGEGNIVGHAFFVPNDARDNELALNNRKDKYRWDNMSVSEVKEQGDDITDEVMGLEWGRL